MLVGFDLDNQIVQQKSPPPSSPLQPSVRTPLLTIARAEYRRRVASGEISPIDFGPFLLGLIRFAGYGICILAAIAIFDDAAWSRHAKWKLFAGTVCAAYLWNCVWTKSFRLCKSPKTFRRLLISCAFLAVGISAYVADGYLRPNSKKNDYSQLLLHGMPSPNYTTAHREGAVIYPKKKGPELDERRNNELAVMAPMFMKSAPVGSIFNYCNDLYCRVPDWKAFLKMKDWARDPTTYESSVCSYLAFADPHPKFYFMMTPVLKRNLKGSKACTLENYADVKALADRLNSYAPLTLCIAFAMLLLLLSMLNRIWRKFD